MRDNTTTEVHSKTHMIVSPFERPADVARPAVSGFNDERDSLSTMPGQPRNDAISRLLPPWFGGGNGQGPVPPQGGLGGVLGLLSGTSLLGSIGGLLEQLGAMLAQLFGYGSAQPQQYFPNAQASSVGDPHLSFNGMHWDSMSSHPDLLRSDSIPGGFQLSTEVTQPGANGVTLNRQATIATNFGATAVSLDTAGNATILENGNRTSLTAGQTIDLGNGQTASRLPDGTLNVVCSNGQGGKIATTLRVNGAGVDVSVNANDVDLAGDLVTRQA
jgi:hypothetical protein